MADEFQIFTSLPATPAIPPNVLLTLGSSGVASSKNPIDSLFIRYI